KADGTHSRASRAARRDTVETVRRSTMPMNELESFLEMWDREAENTLKLLRVLPATEYGEYKWLTVESPEGPDDLEDQAPRGDVTVVAPTPHQDITRYQEHDGEYQERRYERVSMSIHETENTNCRVQTAITKPAAIGSRSPLLTRNQTQTSVAPRASMHPLTK